MRLRCLPLLLALACTVPAAQGAELHAGSARPHAVVVRTLASAPYDAALAGLRGGLDGVARVSVVDVDRRDPDAAAAVRALAPDVVVALGSSSAAWARDELADTPVVFAMVLNPVTSGLVDSMRRPGGRVTGASLDIPFEAQFEILRDVVGARRVAVLANPQHTARLLASAGAAARSAGVELQVIQVSQPGELQAALERLHGFDALWAVADRTVLAHGGVERILLHTLESRLPFMGLSEQYVRAGALLGFAASYPANGAQAAALVQRVLAGEPAGAIPVTQPDEFEIHFNPRTARTLGLEVPGDQLQRLRLLP